MTRTVCGRRACGGRRRSRRRRRRRHRRISRPGPDHQPNATGRCRPTGLRHHASASARSGFQARVRTRACSVVISPAFHARAASGNSCSLRAVAKLRHARRRATCDTRGPRTRPVTLRRCPSSPRRFARPTAFVPHRFQLIHQPAHTNQIEDRPDRACRSRASRSSTQQRNTRSEHVFASYARRETITTARTTENRSPVASRDCHAVRRGRDALRRMDRVALRNVVAGAVRRRKSSIRRSTSSPTSRAPAPRSSSGSAPVASHYRSAQRGVRVHGIELSPAMVAAAPRAARRVDTSPRPSATSPPRRVDGTFTLVYLLRNTITNLTTQDEQVDAFHNAAAHLEPGGCFVIENYIPELQRLPPGETTHVFSADSRRTSRTRSTTSRRRSRSHTTSG